MDPVTRLLMGGPKGYPTPLTEPLLFIGSRDSSGYYHLHGVTTTGTKIGTFSLPQTGGSILNGPTGFFYNPYLYLMPRYDTSTCYKIDCNTMTSVKTITLPTSIGKMGGMSPISTTEMISVSANLGNVYLFDLTTDTFITTAYPTSENQIAQTHGIATFFDETATGLTNIGTKVFWTGCYTANFYLALNSATWDPSTKTLGAATVNQKSHNYSRNIGMNMSSTKAVMHSFGTNDYRFNNTDTDGTEYNPASLGGGYSYSTWESYNRFIGVGSNSTYVYLPYEDTSPGVSGHNFKVCAVDPFSSTTPTPTDLGMTLKSGFYYYTPQDGSFLARINESDYVGFIYYDVDTYGATTSNAVIKIINGTSVVTTYTCDVGSSYTGGNNGTSNSISFSPLAWSSNLLYSGSNYT